MSDQSTVVTPATEATRSRMHRLGIWTALNPVRVLLVWSVLLLGAVWSAGFFTSHLTGNTNEVSGSDSQRAARAIARAFPGMSGETDFVVLHSTGLTADDETFRAVVATAVDRFRSQPRVTSTASPYDAPQRLISADRRTALIPVGLDGNDKQLQDAARPLQRAAADLSTGRIAVSFTGSAPLAAAAVEQGSVDLARAESYGLPAAAIVLLIAFGSLVAAGIPLLLGILAVLTSFGVLGIAAVFTPFDVFVQTAVSMVAIALGIDYSLFIVTRFREELASGEGDGDDRSARAEAVGRTMATAGSAVLFSGTTVVVSLAGLWLVRSPKVSAMAMGMTAAVASMMLIALTLLPALLGLLGSKVNRLAMPWMRGSLAHPDAEHSVWARLTALVMRGPVVVVGLTTLVLALAAFPVFGLRSGVDLGASAVGDSGAGKGYATVSRAFAPGVLTPVTVVVSHRRGALTDAQLEAIATFGARTPRESVVEVVSVTTVLDERAGGHTGAHLAAARSTAGGAFDGLVSRDGRTTLVTVRPRFGADSARTARLVRDLRRGARAAFAGTDLTVHVGGGPAEIVDVTDESSRALPLVIAAVLAASWVLLLIAFRSLLLPLTAIVMNLLTSAAAFGLAVWIFQEGHGAAQLGVHRTGFIQVLLPLFAFALVFGLSMDYQVFMLSRMREEWERTRDNRRAVQLGITRTARFITAAAAIMVVVFGSFMFTRILEIKQMGFMLGVAVLIDATVIRLLLVPALMRIFGAANWWLPGSMARLLPSRSIDE